MVSQATERVLGRGHPWILRDDETGELAFDLDDEIIGGSTITHAGRVVNPRSRQLLGMEDSSA